MDEDKDHKINPSELTDLMKSVNSVKQTSSDSTFNDDMTKTQLSMLRISFRGGQIGKDQFIELAQVSGIDNFEILKVIKEIEGTW